MSIYRGEHLFRFILYKMCTNDEARVKQKLIRSSHGAKITLSVITSLLNVFFAEGSLENITACLVLEYVLLYSSIFKSSALASMGDELALH